MRWVVLLALVLLPQDPQDPVRALVEKLGSEEVAVREDAEKELRRLGRGVLPAITASLESAAGEHKVRLQRVRDHISALGKSPLVTLEAKDRTLRDIAGDLARQSGVPVRVAGAAAEMKASVSARGTLLWKVVEDLCRARGDLMYRFDKDSLEIFSGKFRTLPSVDHLDLRFFIDRFDLDARNSLRMQGAVLTPPGARVVWMEIKVEELLDDKGSDLGPMPEHFRGPLPDGERMGTDSKRILHHQEYRPIGFGGPSPGATKFNRCRGKVVLILDAGEKLLASVRDPFSKPSSPAGDGMPCLGVDRWKQRDGYLLVDFTVGWSPESVKGLHHKLAPRLIFRSKNGEWRPPYSDYWSYAGPDGMSRRQLELGIELQDPAEVASLDLVMPDSIVNVEIPFDFRDIALQGDGPAPPETPGDPPPPGDPAATFRAISDLVDLPEDRKDELEKEALKLPAFYREVLESEIKQKRELGPLFGTAARIKLQGKSRTFAEYLADLDRVPGWDFYPGIVEPHNSRFDLDVEGWPIEAATRLAEAARMRFYSADWSRPTILATPTSHVPRASLAWPSSLFYRNFAMQAGAGLLRTVVDFSGRPRRIFGVAIYVLTDPGVPAVRYSKLRVIEVIDEHGRPIPETTEAPSAIPTEAMESNWAPTLGFMLAAEGRSKISRLRVSFVIHVPSEVRRYVVTEFEASKPRKLSDEYFDVEVGMEDAPDPRADCVYAKVVPKKDRHADLVGVPIMLFQKLDMPGAPDSKGGRFTGRGDGATVLSSTCSLRSPELRSPVRMEVAIPVGLKERTVYAEFRDIPLK
jgi:hypothetical protein